MQRFIITKFDLKNEKFVEFKDDDKMYRSLDRAMNIAQKLNEMHHGYLHRVKTLIEEDINDEYNVNIDLTRNRHGVELRKVVKGAICKVDFASNGTFINRGVEILWRQKSINNVNRFTVRIVNPECANSQLYTVDFDNITFIYSV